jgi:hypothetical protein
MAFGALFGYGLNGTQSFKNISISNEGWKGKNFCEYPQVYVIKYMSYIIC